MKVGFWDYVRAAFNARPWGMFVPPNWIGLGAVALLGVINPGFWLLGAGLELGYLYTLTTNPRFRRVVAATRQAGTERMSRQQLQALVAQLPAEAQGRYRWLESRCGMILQQQTTAGAGADRVTGLRAQAEGMGRLVWIYLRLLLTRHAITRALHESAATEADRQDLPQRITRLQEQLQAPQINEELRRSLTGQLEILQQRLQKQAEARDKLAFLEAELTRIQEQVELIREQAALAADPQTVSQRIDEIAGTLAGTTQWIQEQQRVYGSMEDLLVEPVPLSPTPAPLPTTPPPLPGLEPPPPRPTRHKDRRAQEPGESA